MLLDMDRIVRMVRSMTPSERDVEIEISRFLFTSYVADLPWSDQKDCVRQLLIDWLDYNEQSVVEEDFILRLLEEFDEA